MMLSVVVLPGPRPEHANQLALAQIELEAGDGEPPGLAAAVHLAADINRQRAHGRHLLAAVCQGRNSTASITKITAMKLSA